MPANEAFLQENPPGSSIANLFGPLFESGRNKRRVEIEVARTEALLNQYEQAILNAFREVENALVAVETFRAENRVRREQLDSANGAADLTWARYEEGLTSFLEVLDIERSRFSSELQASNARQAELESIVQLYQALGGGWSDELIYLIIGTPWIMLRFVGAWAHQNRTEPSARLALDGKKRVSPIDQLPVNLTPAPLIEENDPL